MTSARNDPTTAPDYTDTELGELIRQAVNSTPVPPELLDEIAHARRMREAWPPPTGIPEDPSSGSEVTTTPPLATGPTHLNSSTPRCHRPWWHRRAVGPVTLGGVALTAAGVLLVAAGAVLWGWMTTPPSAHLPPLPPDGQAVQPETPPPPPSPGNGDPPLPDDPWTVLEQREMTLVASAKGGPGGPATEYRVRFTVRTPHPDGWLYRLDESGVTPLGRFPRGDDNRLAGELPDPVRPPNGTAVYLLVVGSGEDPGHQAAESLRTWCDADRRKQILVAAARPDANVALPQVVSDILGEVAGDWTGRPDQIVWIY